MVSPKVDSKYHLQVWGGSWATQSLCPQFCPLTGPWGGRYFSVCLWALKLSILSHHHFINSIHGGLCDIGPLDVSP